MVDYLETVKIFKEKYPDKKQPLPDKIGKYILSIAENMASSRKFLGSYHIKEDLVAEGVYDCLRCLGNYDVTRSEQNPFGYFSMVIYRAFLRRIQKEVESVELKKKLMTDSDYKICEEGEDNQLSRESMMEWYDEDY